jgi:diguanylate cyclase (GGDEF)-like protein
MFHEIHNEGIEDRARAPEIRTLLRKYKACAGETGPAPFEQFNLSQISECRDNVMLLTPDGEGDYLYLYYGSEIANGSGYDFTGQRVRNLPDDVACFSRKSYDRALAEGIPLYSVHRSSNALRVSLWERLILPVTAATGQNFVMVFTKAVQFREELLAAILDSSENGIIALEAVRGEHGEIEDALVVTANRRACEICGILSDDLVGSSAQTSLPMLRRSIVWSKCVEVMRDNRPCHLEAHTRIGGNDHWFKVSLAPLHDGLAMTFADVTELKLANLTLRSQAATLASQIGQERAASEALSCEVSLHKKYVSELRVMAETDPMTGLLNRRSFQSRMETVHKAALATKVGFSLLIIDLDHFKQINDTYGHLAGDAVIKACARLLMDRIQREGDMVARIGGEEFAVILGNTRLEGAIILADALRASIAAINVAVADGRMINFTASFGVAELLASEDTDALFSRADEALYAAKGMGRNRVEIARRNTLSLEGSRAA